ncbi:YjgN family protein [Litoribrevibacter albus]|uniref:DUF898 domain-containing protein n=1 Tax=Litoribrevibacter albus TaxID=1473156 RepID=A0AA37W7X6_9GAMM|nr:YjgN family protein [Litoribrevibacter albus]GLQ33265.1 hypothetical protein GCM10007876_37450 [Litoribrevibacter albus]
MDVTATEDISSDVVERKRVGIEFSGTGKEFFKIWIVNIFLSIITFGVYSAWAKVRTNQYFYSNTSLLGSSFQYLAEPMNILKGRMVAVALLVAYSSVQKLFPQYGYIAFVLLMLAIPGLIVLSLSFRLRNTAYRNITFHFQRDFKKAYVIFALPVLLVSLFMVPLMLHENSPEVQNAYQYNDMLEEFLEDDEISFDEEVELTEFIDMNSLTIDDSGYAVTPPPPVWAFIPYLFLILLFPLWDQMFSAFKLRQSQFGTSNFTFGAGVWDFYKMYLLATGVIIGLGIFLATVVVFIKQTIDSLGMNFVLIAVTTLLTFVIYMLVYAYFSVYKQNLIVNNSSIDEVTLVSSLEVAGLWWIYMSNTVLIACTLGLATPWAKIRAAKYRLENTAIITDSLNNFVAKQEKERRALGEEVGEAFDVDIGF